MTMIMQTVSKSQLKSKLLEYLRMVEKEKKPLIVTHGGKPVAKIEAFNKEDEDKKILESLRGAIIKYEDPTEPVGLEDWEALK